MPSDDLIFLADPAVQAAAMRRALRVLRRSADAEDAVQEAAVRALRYRRSLRSGAPGAPWFLQIVSRVSLDMVSERATRPLAAVESLERRGAPAPDLEGSWTVRDAVRALPVSQRRVVELHDFAGYKTREIASLDGVPHSTVRSHLRRARRSLRSSLAEAAGQ